MTPVAVSKVSIFAAAEHGALGVSLIVTVARTLGLPDQPGRSTMDTLLRFLRDRQMLMVLDNCEHLLVACADLVAAVLGAGSGLTLLATATSER